jgi:hypothetical protein
MATQQEIQHVNSKGSVSPSDEKAQHNAEVNSFTDPDAPGEIERGDRQLGTVEDAARLSMSRLCASQRIASAGHGASSSAPRVGVCTCLSPPSFVR